MRDTTIHLAAARDGDPDSLGWLFARFSPWLLAQARQRLPAAAARDTSAEDVVHDVWLRALPVLPTLRAREGRLTPVLLRFLSTTLVYRTNELIRAGIRRGGAAADANLAAAAAPATRGLLTRVADDEGCRRILAAIDDLPELDRRLVLLRAVEQEDNAAAAALLGLSPNAASLRFNRALRRLRARLGPSLLDELVDSPEPP